MNRNNDLLIVIKEKPRDYKQLGNTLR